MNQARGAQEPTMEEILSSIRRIISEDGKRVGDGAAEAPAAAEPAPVAPLRAIPPTAEPEADADDVLELTEVAPEEPAEPEPLELVEEVAAPTLAEPAPAAEPEASPEPVAAEPSIAPVPELAPVPPAEPVPPPAPVPPPVRAALAPVPEPELEPEPEPEAKPEPQPALELQPEPEPEIEIKAEPEPEAVPDVEHHPEPLEISASPRASEAVSRPIAARQPQPSMTGGSRLMSEATEIASSAALSVLAQVLQPGRGFTEEGRRLVDQIMRERLEVHLSEWMDAHLPGLVERIVREEIARLVESSLSRHS